MNKYFVIKFFLLFLMILFFYFSGAKFEVLLILSSFFLILFFLKIKLLFFIENKIKDFFPFSKNWNSLNQKILLFAVFLSFVFVLKQLIFFVLFFLGIDLSLILLDSMNVMQEIN